MGFQTIFLICLGLTTIQTVCGQLWEFGTDNIPAAITITQYNGQFSFFQKEQHIEIIVPPCHALTYVNVQVKNHFSSPSVFFNYYTNRITIRYSIWQISSSTFTVYAKAVYKMGCKIQQSPPVQAGATLQQNTPPIPNGEQAIQNE